MSDQDRMDRAERIRRMREGRRGNGSEADDEPEEAGDESADAGESPDATATDDGAQRDEPPAETAEPTNGSGTTTTEAPVRVEETAEEGDQDGDEDSAADDAVATADAEVEDVADAEMDDVVADAVDRISGASASLPDAAEVDREADGTVAADDGGDVDAETGDAVAAETAEDADADGETGDEGSTEAAEATRVLEFTLDDEQYCLDISYIEEIVKHEHITRVPNTPAFVEGVVDLRGQITTILNPKVPIEKENTDPGDLIVVFDADAFDEQGHLGWVVDDVRQVSPVTDREVNHPPIDEDYINGIIDRDADEEFVIWTTPDLALEEAA